MTLMSSDYAFTVFLAGAGPERLVGEELRMFRFYQSHRSQFVALVEAQINDYSREKK